MGSNILTGPVLVTPHDATVRTTDARATLGTRGFSEDGEFVYVKSVIANVNSGEPVTLRSGFDTVERGDADRGGFLGVAEVPLASGEYGYVRVKGPCEAYVASGVVAGGMLELSATIGQLKALTSSGQSVGIALEASPNDNGLTSVVLGPQ